MFMDKKLIEDIINSKKLPTYYPDYVTFSRNIFIPVTNVCRNKCHYCGFRRPVDNDDAYLLSKQDVKSVLEKNKSATEALFTFGERPEEIQEFKEMLGDLGYTKMVDYLIDLCKMSIKFGLLPHSNMGLLGYRELEMLKPYNASMGLMLETTASLKAHENSFGKEPEKRIEMIEDAGKLNIPFTTGILIGIGESWQDRIDSISKIGDLHKKFGHIQEIIIQPFAPKSNTIMSEYEPPSFGEVKKTVAIARIILPEEVSIQIPPNLISPYELVKCGASDLGGISDQTIDYINPETDWPSKEKLIKMMKGIKIKERLPIYPFFVKKKAYSEEMANLIEKYSDQEGFRKS